MKFRCTIDGQSEIEKFSRIINYLSLNINNAILKLSKDTLTITDRFSDGEINGIQIKCEISTSKFFSEYRIATKYSEEQQIYLILDDLPSFAKILINSTQKLAKKLTMKLAKGEGGACFVINMDLPTLAIENRVISQTIMVSVVPPSKWFLYSQSMNQKYDVSFSVADVSTMKKFLKQVKTKCEQFRFCVNPHGNVCFKISSEYVDISTSFISTQVITNRSSGDSENSVNISTKRFLAFLDSGTVVLGMLKFYVWSQRALKIDSQNDGMTFSYIIKGIID